MPKEPDAPLRERLIDVGVELVRTEGTGSLGLREIARRAGVSHGAPRRYFPTHQSLLSAIARRGFGDLGARFLAAGAERPAPREHVRALGRAYVGYALEQPGMFELMFRHDLLDSTGQEPSGGPRLREQTLPLFGLLTGLVGACGAAEPEVAAAALWAGLHGVAQLWGYGSLPLVLGTGTGTDDEAGRRLAALVDAVVDAHLGAGPA
ncbi:TetR/AcrR family transcriptional regulator [Streptomyces lavendulae]|uniref:TetR/AcrR family transcriptional regulator n=1 Tax=Streptomyces lavendulae TaxID=1914 RepID=UPI0024A529D0|nr:TetR/AcrR family transcriptional regulator [Streptomyces lavendulae]GLX16994.1 TetR family transcriptional regulator [Streptomyces lavendulae subsp. lavendulae]GLX29501.1 TetR family transcriptional regulator [Streptomyces lavendulae subsp. lavendulae]